MKEEIRDFVKSNWLLLAICITLVAGMAVYWFNSPLYNQYLESRRTDAIMTLALNYSVIPSDELNEIKIKYNITDEEIEQYTSITAFEKFKDGAVMDSGAMEKPTTLDMLIKVDNVLGVALAAGIALFIFKEFGLKEKIKEHMDRKHEESN